MSSPGIREQTLVVCALIGSAQMTWGVVVPVLPLYLDLFGISIALLGPIVAAFAIGRAVANLPAGMLLRRLPPRRYVWTAAAALLAITAVTGLASDVGWLIAARLGAGILGGTVVTVGFAALVAGAPVASRGSVMATATVVQMSAAAAGAVLGGAVVEWLGVTLTFVVAALPLALCLMWEVFRPARAYWNVFRAAPAPAPASTPRSLRRGPLMVALCAVAFATFFARFAGEQGLVPVLGYSSGGMTPITLGVAMAVGTVVSLATLPVAGRLADRGVRAGLLLPGAIVGAGSLAVLPALGTPWAFGAAIVAYSVATSVVNIVPGVITAEGYPPQTVGTVVGLTRTAGDLGAAAGPLAVFGLAAIVGNWAASGALALVFLAAIVLFTWVIRHSHASPTAEVFPR